MPDDHDLWNKWAKIRATQAADVVYADQLGSPLYVAYYLRALRYYQRFADEKKLPPLDNLTETPVICTPTT